MSDSNQIMLCIVDVQEKLFLAMPEERYEKHT